MSEHFAMFLAASFFASILYLIAVDEAVRTNRFAIRSLFLLTTLTAMMLSLAAWALRN
jgi:hypothetical protein